MAVRSRRLFGPVTGAVVSPGALIYTVPVGRTAVLRTLSIVNASGISETTVHVYLDVGAGPTFFWTPQPLANAGTVVFPGEIVLNPGDRVYFLVGPNVPGMNIFGSGSLLLGAPE